VTESANVELVRSIFADLERGDFSRADWAHPDIEYVVVDGPAPAHWTGLASMAAATRDILSVVEDARFGAEECRELDADRVLVFSRHSGRAKVSGVEVGEMRAGAGLFHIRDGKVNKLFIYLDRDRALADLGLEG
jgi:ketosteroid isomerase-like protein